MKIAVAKPNGKAIIIAPKVTKKVPTIIGAAPKYPAVGYQIVPKRNSSTGTSPKNENPVLNKNIIIRKMNTVAIEANMNNTVFTLRSRSFNWMGANLWITYSSNSTSVVIVPSTAFIKLLIYIFEYFRNGVILFKKIYYSASKKEMVTEIYP